MSNIKGRNKTEKPAHDFIDFFEETLPGGNSEIFQKEKFDVWDNISVECRKAKFWNVIRMLLNHDLL